MSIFSKNLRFLRESKGLKLDEFEPLGIKKGTMSNYELGNTEPKLELLCEISKFFRISIDDLLLKDISEEGYNKKDTPKEVTPTESIRDFLNALQEKDKTIISQAEKIGRLENEIKHLKEVQKFGRPDAEAAGVADVG